MDIGLPHAIKLADVINEDDDEEFQPQSLSSNKANADVSMIIINICH